jgi:hypothetical protein
MPLDALSRLCLIRVKVERAKKLLGDLERELTRYRSSTFTVIGTGVSPHTRKPIPTAPGTFHTLPQVPFDAIAASGDIIQNLRSSLDHLAYQLVLVGTNDVGSSHPRRIQFPIAESFAAYEIRKARQIEGMRDDAKHAIDAAKPYKGGNGALWSIHQLNNIDKHRSLFTVGQDHLFVADWLPGGYPYWCKVGESDFAGVFDDKAEKELQSEIDKAVSNVEITQDDALLPTLHRLLNFTDGFVKGFLPFLE